MGGLACILSEIGGPETGGSEMGGPDDAEYRKQRQGSFGSIHTLLNHNLLGDRIRMARFEGGGAVTPPLATILFVVRGYEQPGETIP